MAQFIPALAPFEEWAARTEAQIVRLAHPGFDYDARVTKGWAMARLDHALYALVPYLLIVVVGLLRRKPLEKGNAEKEESGGALASFAKEPIKLVQALYNTVQVLLCGWMVAAAILEAVSKNYGLICNSFDVAAPGMAFVEHVFFLSKILDFFDTFFIVVRGKWSQFSFLHVYHHISIYLIYYLVTVCAYDGDVYYTIIANSTVHFFMYLYYLLTTFGIRPSWGKNLTELQMLQFITMNAQALYIIFSPACPYPKPLTTFYLFYIISLLALFMQFYLQRWIAAGAKKRAAAKAGKHE